MTGPDYVPISDLTIVNSIGDNDLFPLSDGSGAYAVKGSTVKSYAATDAAAAAADAAAAAADAQAAERAVSTAVSDASEALSTANGAASTASAAATAVTQLDGKVYSKDLSSAFTFTNGRRINYNSGASQTAETSTSSASDFVNIEGFKTLILTRRIRASEYSGASGIAFYSSNTPESYLSGVPESYDTTLSADTYRIERIAVPSGAKYVRTTWWISSSTQYGEVAFLCLGERYSASVTNQIYDAKISRLLKLQSLADKMLGEDISGRFGFTDDYRINYTTGARNSSDTGAASDFASVAGFESVLIVRRYLTTGSGASGLAFYTAADPSAYISGVPESGDPARTKAYLIERIAVPATAQYMRTTWWPTDSEYYGDIRFFCIGEKKGWHTVSVDQLNSALEQISEANLTVPGYYYENGYIDNRITSIRSILDSYSEKGNVSNPEVNVLHNGDAFFWFTDPHIYWWAAPSIYNGLNAVKLIRYVAERTNIRKVFCGGDLVGGTGMTAATCTTNLVKVKQYLSPIWDDLHMVIGNHEWNNPSADPEDNNNMLTIGRIYSLLEKDKEGQYGSVSTQGDYWFDNVGQKIRYFVIGASYNATISSAQVAWLGTELGNVPDGYTVIVLSHMGATKTGGVMTEFAAVAGMLDAAKSHESYTYSGVTYNFASFGAAIACVICGHCHEDESAQTTGGIWVISTTCDRGPNASSTEEFNAVRGYGTVNEQAIDVYLIDTTDRVIKTIRLGGSWDGSDALENPDRTFSY